MIEIHTAIRTVDEDQGVPLAAAFRDSELRRLTICLERLLPHVRLNDVAITGGVAIQLGMAEIGHRGSRETIADLDMVASSLDAVSPSVAQTFLVSHYHVAQPGVAKFMVQLVDPVTRIRVDVFPDLVDSLARARVVKVGAQSIRALGLEDIFQHKLLTISKASPANAVDPKHADDAYALGKLLQRSVAPVDNRSLAKDVYGIEADVSCRRCDLSSNSRFPLAARDQICELLGWTRRPELALE